MQTAMVGASICFFTGATVSSPGMVFVTTIGANLCIGAYWALINVFRNKYLVSDWRDGSVALSRMLSAALCIGVLNMIHHSSMLTLVACAALMAGATYFHHRTASLPPLEEEEDV